MCPGYGKITLVRKITGSDSGRLYAIKQVRKTTNLRTMNHFINERHVLEQVRWKPFLATLHYAFESEKDLNLVLIVSQELKRRRRSGEILEVVLVIVWGQGQRWQVQCVHQVS